MRRCQLQAKLLRALQERVIDRVGGTTPISINIRVLATSNRDMQDAIQKGEFREDLYFRLSVVKVILPPLRERSEDISLIVEKFLLNQRYNKRLDGSLRVSDVDDDALKMLARYAWPGNVRKLNNIVERAVSLASSEKIDGALMDFVFQDYDH